MDTLSSCLQNITTFLRVSTAAEILEKETSAPGMVKDVTVTSW